MANPAQGFGFGPFDDVRGMFRSLVITLAAGLFLAMAGAFGTNDAPILWRLGYWISLMLVGWAWSVLVTRYLFRAKWLGEALWLRIAAASVVAAIPITGAVVIVGRLTFGSHYRTGPPPILFAYVLVVCVVLMLINVAVDRGATVTAATDQPPKFLERLPLKLRGGEIWAVEAEDHYLRLHTSKGQDLILMRLSDAIAELEGIEGAQVHRSWWVARDAITAAQRGDGRATLTLTDGSEVPVSRTHARLLREKGWI
jgi:hypothetical protein